MDSYIVWSNCGKENPWEDATCLQVVLLICITFITYSLVGISDKGKTL